MNTKRIVNTLLAATLAAGIGVSGAAAGPVAKVTPSIPGDVVLVADGCYAIGAALAAQNGGTLAAATAKKSGGQNVCVIVVLIPGKNGDRPRRQQFVVPQ